MPPNLNFFLQIYELRALYHAVFTHQMELKAKRASKKIPGVVKSSEAGKGILVHRVPTGYTTNMATFVILRHPVTTLVTTFTNPDNFTYFLLILKKDCTET